MRRNRRVKIIATLGPASSTPEMMKRLFEAGADVFRINMSHASHEDLRDRYEAIRAIEREVGSPIGILCDLQGPKFRVGLFEEQIILPAGAYFNFDHNDAPGDASRVYLPHPEIFEGVEPGHQLLLNDGKLRFVVRSKTARRIETEVLVGGALSSRKGVSLPDTVLPVSPLTPIDRENLEYGCQLGVDWIALSFVQRAEDVIEAKQLIKGRAGVLSKIEKPAAVHDIERIVAESDAIMVARGDLGVEMPLEKVPGVQKRLTRLARRQGKPVVIATQMLESMISAPVPTRAEVSDVATAVFEGADAIMLSAESAAGQFPYEAVATMNSIAIEVEQDPLYDGIINSQRPEPDHSAAGAMSAAACSIAEDARLVAIICYTSTGATALRVARQRPRQPILALSTSEATSRRLAMAWGMHCVLTEDPHSVADMVTRACRLAAVEGMAKLGDKLIVSAGLPFGTPGATNMLRVVRIEANAMRAAQNAHAGHGK
ncbi:MULTISPECIES: pyruvate kinase [Rhodomicrobium]|uniref:pyruvate kinase n=1 Tax=Rhodomicrobium TaxID=1068 RepID=UPI000B4BFF93|nr:MULTISPECIES: pyruvate kinase [Rhodomicrobium]